VNVNAKDAEGQTALQNGVATNSKNIVDMILQHAKGGTKKVRQHNTNPKMTSNSFLVRKAINLKDEDGDCALHYAAMADNDDAAVKLMAKGADVHAKNNSKSIVKDKHGVILRLLQMDSLH